uniref:Ubiquitin-like domain-containing protein n=1 Tax=Caenorhabditis tropicalis TaxID=1561998 RepID=A0A1I7V293_9PELO
MSTFITIRLVGEPEDRLFERIEMDPNIHVKDLMTEVEVTTKIPPRFQVLKFRGEPLPTLEHPLRTIKFGEEIIVNHSMIIEWNAYKKKINIIQQMTSSGLTSGRRNIAVEARSHLSPLFASNFFRVYIAFSLEELEISSSWNFLIHNIRKYLHRSALAFFERLFPDKKVEIKAKSSNQAGSHLGSFVLLDGTSLFYVKTLGAILGPETEIDFPSRPKFDMIEVFVYYTLKEIGIGPSEVFVIPDSTKSELVFLSTKLIEGFVTASGVTANDMLNESKSANQGKVIITPEIRKEMRQEMKLLSSLLCLTDLLGNPDNHGVIEHIPTEEEKLDGKFSRYELRIVDFGINLRMIDDEPSIFNSSTDVQSLIMYSKKWKLSESVEKAKESMENDPVLKNNKNGNVKTYNRYIKRLDAALEKIESGN